MRLLSATGLAVALSVFLAGTFAPFMPLVAIYLFCVTYAATYFGQTYPAYFYPLFVIHFSAVFASCILANGYESLQSVALILIGTALVVLFQLIYTPGFVRNEVSSWTMRALHHLDLVSKEVFACFLGREYIDNIYLFERRMHVRKTRYMRGICRLRDAARLSKTKIAVEKIDELYDILMDCAQLRRRVTDHTVFSLCATELSAISVEITKLFTHMAALPYGNKNPIDTFALAEKIQLFEDNYHHVLKVTAREPLAFLLFIASLKVFREKAGLYE